MDRPINPIFEADVNEKFNKWLEAHFHGELSETKRAIWLNCWLDGMNYGLDRAKEILSHSA